MKKWPLEVKYVASPYSERVWLARNRKEWMEVCQWLGCPEEGRKAANVGGVTAEFGSSKGDDVILVGLFVHKPGVLMHECIHAAWRVLDAAGVRVKVDNHEALTYLAQHMFEYFWEHRK